MRKLILILCLMFVVKPVMAIDRDALLSLLATMPEGATQGKVTSMLGQPEKIEGTKKKTTWRYTHDNSDYSISWDNRSESLVCISYKCTETGKAVFDNALAGKLKSGKTNMGQALGLLGAPQDITIKEKTQEMHYAYHNKVLRLFFRDRVLVDYCLY